MVRNFHPQIWRPLFTKLARRILQTYVLAVSIKKGKSTLLSNTRPREM